MPSVYLSLENSFELNLQPTPTSKILKRRLAKENKTGKKNPKEIYLQVYSKFKKRAGRNF